MATGDGAFYGNILTDILRKRRARESTGAFVGRLGDLSHDTTQTPYDRILFRLIRDSLWTDVLGREADTGHIDAEVFEYRTLYPDLNVAPDQRDRQAIRIQTNGTTKLPTQLYAYSSIENNAQNIITTLMNQRGISNSQRVINGLLVRDLFNIFKRDIGFIRGIGEYLSETNNALMRFVDEKLRPTARGGSDYDKLKSYSISDVDFQDALGLKPFLYYPDLRKVRSVDELFDKQGRCAILFLTSSLYHGHWTCLMKRGNVIEYWDSYGGYRPDGERKWLSHNELVNLHEDQPLLSNLLRNSKYTILYNPYPYQSHSPQTNTCGKHCITRLYYKALKEPQYRQMIRESGKTPDQFVIDFVYSLIGK